MVDLDRYLRPSRDPAVLAARREALLDQLGWLEAEAGALVPLLTALPAWAVDQAPLPTDRTAKETFASLAALDREVYPAWLDQIGADEAPALAMPDPAPRPDGANEQPLDALLADLRAARAALHERLAALPAEAWSRPLSLDGQETDLYGLVLAIVQHDADELKELAYRLHDADLSGRPSGR